MEVGGAAALFGVCLFTGLGIPFPEEVPLLVAGWELRQGRLALVPALGAAFVALFLRDVAAFALGRLLRQGTRARWLRRVVESSKGRWAQARVDEMGRGVLVLARFAAGFRVPLLMAAGMSSVQWRFMLVLEAPGLLLTIPLTLWLGWRYGPMASSALDMAMSHRWASLGVLALAVALTWGAVRAWSGRKDPTRC